ncbi:MAG: hypothetical protein AAGA54_00665 [Myxococcota bacterium]
MQRFSSALPLLCTVALGGCNPSELKDYLEGSREIPAEYESLVPDAAREDLIDARPESDKLSLYYHDGDWSTVLGAFAPKLEAAGYLRLGACPTANGEADGSVTYAKLTTDGTADVVVVALSILLRSSGHFFINVQHEEMTRMYLPEGCAFAESATKVCEDASTNVCRFKRGS